MQKAHILKGMEASMSIAKNSISEAPQQITTDNVSTTPATVEANIEMVAKTATPEKQKKKLRRLTYKQREFVAKYFKNKGNGTKTALEVYNTNNEHTAQVIASENISKPVVISAMEASYLAQGLTKDEFGKIISKSITKGLDIHDKPLQAKDHVKFCNMYIDTVPGVKAPTRQETSQDNTYNINLSMVQTITQEVRKALQQAIRDTNAQKLTIDTT